MTSCLSLLVVLFFIVGYAHSVSFWEPPHTDINRKIKRVWENLDVEFCQTFPELSPLPSSYGPLQDLIKQFNENISLLVAATDAPSIAVNLVYDQDIIWSQGYGLKNLSDPSAGAPDGDTLYQIGSNTKLFTALLGLIAQDKGLMSFTDEVTQYVPGFNPKNPFPSKRSINFNQLASHMAGLARSSPCIAGNCSYSNEVMWPRVSNTTLINPPGLVPQYSNLGFAVLGHSLEEILGGSWNDLIQQEILTPLGMNNSGTNVDTKFLSGRAVGYTTGNAEATIQEIGWESPAGSMYSSTNDLAKFISFTFRDDMPYMQQADQILDGLSIREWRQPRYINRDLTGYGLPWEIISSPIIYTKGGAIAGYLSMIVTVPQLKLGMVVLQSSDSASAFADIFALWSSSFLQPFAQILQDIAPPPFIPPSFKELIGVYSLFNLTISINITQTQYYPMPTLSVGPDAFLLKYISENIYKASTQGMPLTCSDAEGGDEAYVYFTPGPSPSFSCPDLFYGLQATKIEQ